MCDCESPTTSPSPHSSTHLLRSTFTPGSTPPSSFFSTTSSSPPSLTSSLTSPSPSSSTAGGAHPGVGVAPNAAGRKLQVGRYLVGHTLEYTCYGRIRLGQDEETGETVDLHFVEKSKLSPSSTQFCRLRDELPIFSLLRHPHIATVLETIDTASELVVVVERCANGVQLEPFLAKQGSFRADVARKLFQQFLCAIQYLHHFKAGHCVLTPRNILLISSANMMPQLKLVNLPFGHLMTSLESTANSPSVTSALNSPYRPPEMAKHPHCSVAGPTTDAFACGVFLFTLLVGKPPFEAGNVLKVVRKMERGEYEIPASVPSQCLDLIRGLLSANPLLRPRLAHIWKSEWVAVDRPIELLQLTPQLQPEDTNVDHVVLQYVAARTNVPYVTSLKALKAPTPNPVSTMYHTLVRARQVLLNKPSPSTSCSNSSSATSSPSLSPSKPIPISPHCSVAPSYPPSSVSSFSLSSYASSVQSLSLTPGGVPPPGGIPTSDSSSSLRRCALLSAAALAEAQRAKSGVLPPTASSRPPSSPVLFSHSSSYFPGSSPRSVPSPFHSFSSSSSPTKHQYLSTSCPSHTSTPSTTSLPVRRRLTRTFPSRVLSTDSLSTLGSVISSSVSADGLSSSRSADHLLSTSTSIAEDSPRTCTSPGNPDSFPSTPTTDDDNDERESVEAVLRRLAGIPPQHHGRGDGRFTHFPSSSPPEGCPAVLNAAFAAGLAAAIFAAASAASVGVRAASPLNVMEGVKENESNKRVVRPPLKLERPNPHYWSLIYDANASLSPFPPCRLVPSVFQACNSPLAPSCTPPRSFNTTLCSSPTRPRSLTAPSSYFSGGSVSGFGQPNSHYPTSQSTHHMVDCGIPMSFLDSVPTMVPHTSSIPPSSDPEPSLTHPPPSPSKKASVSVHTPASNSSFAGRLVGWFLAVLRSPIATLAPSAPALSALPGVATLAAPGLGPLTTLLFDVSPCSSSLREALELGLRLGKQSVILPVWCLPASEQTTA